MIWTVNDYVPADGGPSMMVRYAERPDLSRDARTIARGLAEARLGVYRVGSAVPGVWLEIEPLMDGVAARVAWRDGFDRLEIGEIVVTRVVHATTMPTVWGIEARFPGDSERRWKTRLAALSTDPAHAALIVLGFHPDNAAEPISDGIELDTLTWSIDDDEAVLEALEREDLWECLGEAIPTGWAFAWPDAATSGAIDLGGWREHPSEIEVARLVVEDRTVTLLSAEHATLLEIASHLETSVHGLIMPEPQPLFA